MYEVRLTKKATKFYKSAMTGITQCDDTLTFKESTDKTPVDVEPS
jgi:hypothetical protein